MPDGTVVRSVFGCGWWQPRLDGVEADTEASGIAGSERIQPQYAPTTPALPEYVHWSVSMYAAQMADFARGCVTGATQWRRAPSGSPLYASSMRPTGSAGR